MLNGKNILITGGTGSFGQKFAQIILEHFNPNKVIIYSRDEFKQDEMRKSFLEKLSNEVSKLVFFIGDIRDKERLYRACNGIDYIIHAAALKQIPTCEYNPFEAIKTNIYGAQNIIDVATNCKVKKVIALSTDKAVMPINLYGGTKLVSEKLFLSANSYGGTGDTKFCVVRYGNVVGSRGSVIPFFKNLLDNGANELPITDFRMTRFWITLEQGVELVLKAIKESKGGEIYISKIPSFKVTDLARALKHDVKLKQIGIREGEKLHEVMIPKDNFQSTYEYEKHYIIYPHLKWWDFEKHFTLGGEILEEGFEYRSDNNMNWITEKDIREYLKKLFKSMEA